MYFVMTNKPQIAVPVGLVKFGQSGAGNDPMLPLVRIRKDIFQTVDMKVLFQLTGNYAGQSPAETMIMDFEYDGYKMEDPHSARPMSFITDDPGKPGKFLVPFKAPNAGPLGGLAYSAPGRHHVKASIAPRIPPLTQSHMKIVVPVDGATKKIQITTVTKVPIYNECGTCIVGYKDEPEVSEVTVPIETEITDTGYSVTQIMAPRDFSPEAGGATAEFDFEIFPVMGANGQINDPRDPVPEVQD
jgi:hypothetical protein